MAATNLLYSIANLFFQAADILSSAPAMQIRYLEAMQSMAKSASAKVIFLPASGMNSAVSQQLATTDTAGEGPSGYSQEQHEDGFQSAMKARIVEDI